MPKKSPPSSPAPNPLDKKWAFLALVLILGLFLLIVSSFFTTGYFGGADEASYFLTAKGLATHADPAYYNPDPAVFVPENMVETRPGVFYQKYPPGFPLLLAIAYHLGGHEAAFYINPLFAVLGLIGVFLLVRQILDDHWALIAALFFALHPLYLLFSVSALSHTTATACVVWGMYFLYRWGQPSTPTQRNGQWHQAAFAALLLGYAVGIRYTEATLILPVLFIIASRCWTLWRNRSSLPDKASKSPSGLEVHPIFVHVLLMLTLAILALVPTLAFQRVAFGSAFTSGYSLTNESTAFSWSGFQDHTLYAIISLCDLGYGLFILFPLAFIGLGYLLRKQTKLSVFLALWILPTLLIYIAYYWSTPSSPALYLRFFLTIYPALLLAALVFFASLTARYPRLRWIALLALLALGFGNFQKINQAKHGRFDFLMGMANYNGYAADLARKNLPSKSVVIADDWMAYYLVYASDFTVFYPRYFYEKWTTDHLASVRSNGVLDFNELRAQRFNETFANKSQPQLDTLLRQRLLHYHAQGKTIALLVSYEKANIWITPLAPDFTLEPIAKIDDLKLVLFRLVPAKPSPTLLPSSAPPQ